MNEKFKTIQEIIDYTISEVPKLISSIKTIRNQYIDNARLLKYIRDNTDIIFLDIIYNVYTIYINHYPSEILFNTQGEMFKTITNAHLYFNCQGDYSETEKIDNSDDKITREKIMIIGDDEVCTLKTYNSVQRKIKTTGRPIYLDFYKRKRLFGILASVYSNTEYNKPFFSDVDSTKKLYKSLSTLYKKTKNNTELDKILNDPYNIFILEKIFKTERLYLLRKLALYKNEYTEGMFDYDTRMFSTLINYDFRLSSYALIDSYNNETVNDLLVRNLCLDVLPNMISIFEKNFNHNFEVKDIPNNFIENIIKVFKNHYQYFKKTKLNETLFKDFRKLVYSENGKKYFNTTNREKLMALLFDLFDITEVEEDTITYHTDTMKDYIKQLSKLIKNEKDLYHNNIFIELIDKIHKKLDGNIHTIYEINSIIFYNCIKNYIDDIKKEYISLKDDPALSETGLYILRINNNPEAMNEYEIFFKKFHSIFRNEKYKDKIKMIKEYILFFNTFKNIFVEFMKLNGMLRIRVLYQTKILHDYIYSKENQSIAINKYKSIVEKYELFSTNEAYENIYPPAYMYLYLSPEKRNEFTTHAPSEGFSISYIYGQYSVRKLNKKYFKNSNVKFKLYDPFRPFE
jgi:hypothetical protein